MRIDQSAKETIPISIEEEMRRSYLAYAMSVIVGRALPDARDGLKPVHRRVMFAMHELSNDWNRAHKKSARIVGEVIGKYHPHGELAIYDTIVRMAQHFSLRYMLVDGQGNFGSVDGDNAAAMRYTEIRMSRIAHELLADIEQETVNFGANYDGSLKEPLVLPARIPNLLINGSSGIAVGMATNIPPHNLGEVIEGCLALLRQPEISIDELIKHIPAPDFPTAAFIYGTSGVIESYRTGRGRVVMRARCSIEGPSEGTSEGASDTKRTSIIVEELPYQVNKRVLQEKIAELVRDKRLEGIRHVQDESDRSGMRLVIELKRGENAEIVLNNLYKLTQLQDTFGVNMVALVDGQPQLLNLKQLLHCFLRHRREVITRRTVFEQKKAAYRAHVLEGLAVALSNIDAVIALIKKAPTPAIAKERLLAQHWPSTLVEQMLARAELDREMLGSLSLMAGFGWSAGGYRLTDVQAQAILDLRLQRLTALEQDKILSEYQEILAKIADLLDILKKPERVTGIIQQELASIKAQYQDNRRSEIIEHGQDLSNEDLIAPQDRVVTLSRGGYIKAQPVEDYQAQRRGGRGKQATVTKQDDFIDQLFVANTHDFILCFSDTGRVYWLKVYELPLGTRVSRGKPMVGMLPLAENEKISAVLAVKKFSEDYFVFMATSLGTVKKTPLSDFKNPRRAGIIAVALDDGDHLIGVQITDGKHDVMLFSDSGKAVRFNESDVRSVGRGARGVRGMLLDGAQKVIAMLVAENEQQMVLTVTENGFGKRTHISEYTRHGRGTKGMIAIQTSARNGRVVAAALVDPIDEIMLITTGGVLIRMRVSEIRGMSRATQGVTLISVDAGEKLQGLAKVIETDAEDLGLMPADLTDGPL